ncbi:MAG: lysylphosphatidylglycerol synthase transmembrane domain-containing protein [Acidobacteriota bacterium]|nr:lysylphosphatidylglycerol synthase transmembrane domain-containing protein [Acidobacteriota bacterium]
MISYRTKVAIKILITLALLGFLAYQMDLNVLVKILLSANPVFILLGAFIQFTSMFLGVVRWQTILRNFGINSRLVPLIKITFIGYFFNLFLPSGIGGDFFRSYYLAKQEDRGMSTTVTTTILERSAGLCALLIIGTSFAALQDIRVEGVRLFYVFLIMITLYLLGILVLFHSWMHRRISSFLIKRNLEHLEARMELVYQGLNELRRNKGSILKALVLSLGIQFLSVFIVWVAAQAIQIEASFGVFLIFVPLINLSIMVPLTINGIGLRESLFYLLFSQIGLPVEMAVGLSLVTFALYILTASPGLVIYSLYKKEEHLDEMMVEPLTPDP